MTEPRTPRRVLRLVATSALLALFMLPGVASVPGVYAAAAGPAAVTAVAATTNAVATNATTTNTTTTGATTTGATTTGAATTGAATTGAATTGAATTGAATTGAATTGAAANTTVSGVAESVTVSLTSLTPTISLPRAPVTISGSVRNVGPVPIASPVVRAFIGGQPLTSRSAVAEWADTKVEQQLVTEGVRTPLGLTLGVGRSARFTLTIAAIAIPHRESFAVLPLLVDVVGTLPSPTGSPGTTFAEAQNLGSLHTFLPALSSVKAYEPFAISWLVPLTLDPDPALLGTDSAARTAAWTAAIGPGSRLDHVMTGTDSPGVTWAVDPAVLGPPTAPTSGNTTTPRPTDTATSAPGGGSGSPDQDQVTRETTALADRLRASAARHTLWSLPYADPDLAALLPLTAGVATLADPITSTKNLETAVGAARDDIAWPVEGVPTITREKQLRAAFSSRGLSAIVTPASDLADSSGITQNASRRSSDGLPLLTYDDALSRTFAQTSSAATGTVTIQRFLADTLALLGERPGTPNRSVLVAAPRTFSGDPTVLRSFFASVANAKWLVPTSSDQLLVASQGAPPEAPVVPTEKPTSPTSGSPATPTSGSPATPTLAPAPTADPLLPAASPLTVARLATISRLTSAVDGVASIRDDPEPFRTRWTDAQNQTVSVRWRGHERELAAVDAATQGAINAVTKGVNVAPSSVNFFADKGVLQITVVNDLDIPVHGVHLTLTPGQPRLRIEQQPKPLRIGAKSRTNVPVRVTAVAAGVVPIRAVLTTANGTPLGQTARVNVRVQPTSTWIYWVLGAGAGVILVLGTWRSLRRGSTRASRPAVREVRLDV